MNSNNQMINCWYFATKEEALKWPIAHGSMLTFKDPDGKHFYVKSYGWSPYDKITFIEYVAVDNEPAEKTDPQETPFYTGMTLSDPKPEKPIEIPYNQENNKVDKLEADVEELKSLVTSFINTMKAAQTPVQGNNQNNKQYYNEKKGNKS